MAWIPRGVWLVRARRAAFMAWIPRGVWLVRGQEGGIHGLDPLGSVASAGQEGGIHGLDPSGSVASAGQEGGIHGLDPSGRPWQEEADDEVTAMEAIFGDAFGCSHSAGGSAGSGPSRLPRRDVAPWACARPALGSRTLWTLSCHRASFFRVRRSAQPWGHACTWEPTCPSIPCRVRAFLDSHCLLVASCTFVAAHHRSNDQVPSGASRLGSVPPRPCWRGRGAAHRQAAGTCPRCWPRVQGCLAPGCHLGGRGLCAPAFGSAATGGWDLVAQPVASRWCLSMSRLSQRQQRGAPWPTAH